MERHLQDKKDKPPCRFYLKGECTRDKECDFWHAPPCKHYKANACQLGDKCLFLHEGEPAPIAKAKVKGLPAVLMTLVASTLASTRESLMTGGSEAIQVENCHRAYLPTYPLQRSRTSITRVLHKKLVLVSTSTT